MSRQTRNIRVSARRYLGCHRRPDRSFFFRGRQFPLCARCTGVLAGEIAATTAFRFLSPPTSLLLAFCGVMFLDWSIQFMGIRESTNFRRLVTGSLCGYAWGTLAWRLLILLKRASLPILF